MTPELEDKVVDCVPATDGDSTDPLLIKTHTNGTSNGTSTKKTANGYYVDSGNRPTDDVEACNSTNPLSVNTDDEQPLVVSKKQRILGILSVIVRVLSLITILYFFVCSLDLLSSAFTLIGGRSAGGAFSNPLIENPICGLMIGVVATAFLQSSSTSTSITITMVASGLLQVKTAIPIIMGSNIGTSVTGIIVAVTQAGDREQFKKAFSAATVHDMFNWLTVLILLPVEIVSGYLFHLTTALVNAADLSTGGEDQKFLKLITEPFTNLIVQVDKDVLDDIAAGKPGSEEKSLLKYWCEYKVVPANTTLPPPTESALQLMGSPSLREAGEYAVTSANDMTSVMPTAIIGITKCSYIFHDTNLTEVEVGIIVLVIALAMLIVALILMVKILKSLLEGSMASVMKKTINADFPGRAACLTGYVAILIGALVTILVQSSSVVASALTPLVGLDMVTVERVFPMMLGANIGTTSTAILASFAASSETITASFQIAMCHLFFNLTGILIWYPLPFMRKVPVRLAKFFGKTTSVYRWFAGLYLIMMFFIFPLTVFALSIPGWWLLASVGIPVLILIFTVAIINILQKKKPQWLPEKMRTWEFLPECLRSLRPMDKLITRAMGCMQRTCCKCCCKEEPIDEKAEPNSNERKTSIAVVDEYFRNGDINTEKQTDESPVKVDSRPKSGSYTGSYTHETGV